MKKIVFLSAAVAAFAGCSFLSGERAQTVTVKPGADGPLSASTLEAARDLVRAARKDGRLSPEKPIEVVVAPGIYSLSEVFQLGKEDSGTPERPIVWRAEKPGTVRFLGGVKLESSSFAPVSGQGGPRPAASRGAGEGACCGRLRASARRPRALAEPAERASGTVALHRRRAGRVRALAEPRREGRRMGLLREVRGHGLSSQGQAQQRPQ